MTKPGSCWKRWDCLSGREFKENIDGKDKLVESVKTGAQVFDAPEIALRDLRPGPQLFKKVQCLSYLLPELGAQRPDPGRDQIELVSTSTVLGARR